MSEWKDIESAPKDGSEFLTTNENQGFVMQLVHWNTIHGYWQSKGESIHMQATHWFKIPPPIRLRRVIKPYSKPGDPRMMKLGDLK